MFFIVLSSVLVTSFISSVIGMAGGMILMGVLSLLLPVVSAMVLHGVIQMSSNGFRAYLNREHIKWRVLPFYILGAFFGFALFEYLSFTPQKSHVFIALGSFGLISVLWSGRLNLNVMEKKNSFLCGLSVVSAQIFAGASGPVLDAFYYKSALKRHEIVATKALTQVLGHGFKVFFYSRMLFNKDLGFSGYLVPLSILCVLIGTKLGKKVLDKMSEGKFMKYNKYFIFVISSIFLLKGLS